jgi:hypothetical protein
MAGIMLLLLCYAPLLAARSDHESKAQIKAGPPPTTVADVDEAIPAVAPDVPCSLPEVLHAAGAGIQEVVNALPQFTASERVEHREAHGAKWHPAEVVTFNYLAEMHEVQPGMLVTHETRNGSTSPNLFPGGLADFGLPALVLIFHPYFVDEYSMSCEGLGQWEGQPAWQVHFQQRDDRPARLRVYTVGMRSYPAKLKGRAWIAKDNYHMLHLETDLLAPIPEIRLYREHTAINYGTVRFKKTEELWLPSAAEIYLTFRGKIFHRRHSFSDYLIFSVDVDQKIKEPIGH